MIELVLPIYWVQENKRKGDKTVLVSMNWYRNAYFYNQNKMKKHFHDLVAEQLDNDKIEGCFKLKLDLYYKNLTCDGSNVAALIEKFTLDALQEFHVVENDNVKFHLGSTWEIAGRDKLEPRCHVSIIPD